MRVRILLLIFLLTACVQTADDIITVTQLPSKIPPKVLTATHIASGTEFATTTASATELEPTATASATESEATATASATESEATATASATELEPTAIASATELRLTIPSFAASPSATPADCAEISDTYYELRLQVFDDPALIGRPDYTEHSISQRRCPADNWSLPYEYQIIIVTRTDSTNEVVIVALDDIIRRLPNYPPLDPSAENFVDIMIHTPNGNIIFVGRFAYDEAISVYESGLRRDRLLENLGIHVNLP